ncbi:undecaprenyl phosphate translocase family protein [Microbacterium sp. NPDC007973]|uniref:undecaprenyl phosphate translocase family protein n=1 Tax=Microbacterium sp. NPDC007973 TaxID=3364182 RepID=UPI0036E28CA1
MAPARRPRRRNPKNPMLSFLSRVRTEARARRDSLHTASSQESVSRGGLHRRSLSGSRGARSAVRIAWGGWPTISPTAVPLSAAVAVCALVMPGLSGAVLLLIFGLYETTLVAVNERDVPYLLAFAIGAVVGLSLFVNLLRVLLARFRGIMLALMTGLMLGSSAPSGRGRTSSGRRRRRDRMPSRWRCSRWGGAAVVLLVVAMQARLDRLRR